jgi:glycosyltransferase involved in cell wall biosynthesis
VSDRPLISVIIPTYNRERYLREAVESVFGQTYDDWELLVVDDGSTDGTRTYLETLTDPRVRRVLRSHCGNAALLRNVGVRDAGGSHIAFLDSDDAWLPEKLALQIDDLQGHPECGWSYTGYVHMDEWGRGNEWRNRRWRWAPHSGWILEALIAEPALIAMPTVMVTRQLFEAVGGFDESLPRCHDQDLWLRLAESSAVAVVPMPLAKVRSHSENRGTRPLDLLTHVNRMYGRLLARSTSPKLRRLCRRQRAWVNLDLVGKLRWAGRYDEARQALRISFPYAGWHPGWWTGLLKTWLRPTIPAGLQSLYSRLRTGRNSPATPRDPH